MSQPPPAVAIVTDSTCDIPAETAQALQIRIVPALLTMEGKTYQDRAEISRSDFYLRLPTLTTPALTAAPSPVAFEAAYESALNSGARHILSLHVSEHLSGIFNAASQAAKRFGEQVKALDSQHVSMALGFQAILAAEAAMGGAAFAAVIRTAEQARPRARLVALIDTLEFLRRSGRVTWLRAGIGDLLRVKLLVSVVDGWVKRTDMVRTKARALDRLTSIARSWGRVERLAILHSGAVDEAHSLAQELARLAPGPPLITEVTPVIGAHVGPGCVGLAALLRAV